MAARSERLVRIYEVHPGDEVRTNARRSTKPTTVTSKKHLGEGVWELHLETGERRTYQAEDLIVLVTKGAE